MLLLLVGPVIIVRPGQPSVALGRRDASLTTTFPGSFAAQVVERGRDAVVRSIAWGRSGVSPWTRRTERATGEEFLCDVH